MEKNYKVNNLIDHFERINMSQIHLRVKKCPIFNPLLKTEEISAKSGICDAEVDGDMDLLGLPQVIDHDPKEDSKQTPRKEDAGVSANDMKVEGAMESKGCEEKIGWVSKRVKDLQIRTSEVGEKKPFREPGLGFIAGENPKVLNSNNIRDKLEDILRKHCFRSKQFVDGDLIEDSILDGDTAGAPCPDTRDKDTNEEDQHDEGQ